MPVAVETGRLLAPALGDVLLLSAEDESHDTVWPRVDAAGVDVTGAHLVPVTRRRSKSA